jgi:hypothetical protein
LYSSQIVKRIANIAKLTCRKLAELYEIKPYQRSLDIALGSITPSASHYWISTNWNETPSVYC